MGIFLTASISDISITYCRISIPIKHGVDSFGQLNHICLIDATCVNPGVFESDSCGFFADSFDFQVPSGGTDFKGGVLHFLEGHFTSARSMWQDRLRRYGWSVEIRERLEFECCCVEQPHRRGLCDLDLELPTWWYWGVSRMIVGQALILMIGAQKRLILAAARQSIVF